MKLTVIGATGMTGRAAVAEAARRGHTVTAVSRSGREVPGAATAVAADLADTAATTALINDADATILAVSGGRDGASPRPIVDAVAALIKAEPTGRLVVVGGAGSLLDGEGHRLVDDPSFPEAVRPEALAFAEVLELLRAAGDRLAWTFISPAPTYPSPESTGAYIEAADTPAGMNLSPADLAIALVDETEKDTHRGSRFTVASA